MRKTIFSALCVTGLLLFGHMVTAHAGKDENGGSISGSVNFCGKGGVAGMMIYVPGKPYVLLTDDSGRFEFTRLPAGSYDLVYSQQGRILNRNNGIVVKSNSPSLLGEIRFCLESSFAATPNIANPAATTGSATQAGQVDKDGDGVPAPQDCRDDDASIRPGAREICDGVDNDCDGIIDNLDLSRVDNGTAKCVAGQLKLNQCDKNYADCDGDIKNGCEADLMNDNNNCGQCGNACGLEICALGSC